MHAQHRMFSKFAVLGVAAALGLQLLGAPSWGQVATDLPDYAPGSVVTISGQNTADPETGLLTPGYVSGKTVTVVAVGPDVAEPLTRWTDTCSAVVDEAGTWSCQVTLSADPAIAVGDYTYTATSEDANGQPIVETGTFKDGNTDISGFVKNSAAVAIAGATITCSSGCNSPASTTSAANGSFSLHASFSGAGPTTLTLTISASGYATQTVTFTGVMNTVSNAAGTITLVAADSTPPVISYILFPATPDGINGWYRSNVTLTWTVTESESPGSLLKTGCTNQNITADQTEISYSCSATSTGGSSGTTTVSIKRDATASGVSWSGALAVGGNFTYGAVPPVATCAATDATSGPGTCTVTGYSTALGSHTLTATAYDNAGNSTIETRTYSVIAATLTITAKDRSKTYGQSLTLGNTEFTVSGLVGGDTVTSVTLTSAGAAAGAAVAGSPYAIVASAAVGTGLGNYDIGYVNGGLTIDKASLTVTANSFHKTYGDNVTFDDTEFTISGLLNGDTITSVDLSSGGTPASAGVGDFVITPSNATGSGVGNYNVTYVSGTLSVDPAPLTVTADPATATYGSVTPTLTFAVTGFKNGETNGTATAYSAPTCQTTRVVNSPVGSYPITCSGGAANNYTFAYVSDTFTVTKATLTITAHDLTKVYGDLVTFADTEFSVTGLAPDETVTSVTLTSDGAAATAHAGNFAIVPSAALPSIDTGNYNVNYVNGSLTVNPAGLTITANPMSKIYGVGYTFTGHEFTSLGLHNGDSVTSVTLGSSGAAGTAHVGEYVITISGATGSPFTATDYTITYVTDTLTVTKAVLTITAKPQSKTYGADITLPGTDFTTSTLYNGDTVTSASITSTGSAGTAHVGHYPIIISDAVGTISLGDDYNITYVGGTLTVDPAALTVTANNRSKTYGDVVSFDGTEFTVSGLLNTDTVTSVTLTSAGAAAGAAVAGSPYAIVASAAVGTGLDNYDITYLDGALTVGKAMLTVTADSATAVYGNATLALTFVVTGFQNGETSGTAAAYTAPTCQSTRVLNSPVGAYPITCSGGAADNYDFTYVGSTLTVDKALLTVTPGPGQSAQYSDPTPPLGFAVTGFVNDETATTADGYVAPSCTTTRTVGSAPGTYPITCYGGAADNYTFSYNPTHVMFTVTQENAIVTYTGPLFVTTSSSTATTVSIPLSATVQDINDLSTGGYRGDIRNAKVTFYKDGVAIPGCASLTVSAIGSDTTTGTAGCSFTGTAGDSYAITVGVSNYYTGLTDGSSVLTVALGGGTNFITGGGWLAEANSAGTYGADAGTRLNFGFNVKYNKAKTNLQGQANIIFRRGGHTYQIKSNAIASLMVKLDSTGTKGTASFISKASLNDVTNPFSPIALLGGLTLTLTMTDNGEPGSADTIGIQVMDGGTLVFSSTWSGVTTTQKLLSGGNLVVH